MGQQTIIPSSTNPPFTCSKKESSNVFSNSSGSTPFSARILRAYTSVSAATSFSCNSFGNFIMQCTFFLNVVIRKSSVIFQLFPCKNESLFIWSYFHISAYKSSYHPCKLGRNWGSQGRRGFVGNVVLFGSNSALFDAFSICCNHFLIPEE